MDDLCDGPNPHVTIALTERHRLSAVYVDVRRSDQTVALTMNIGARLPLAFSAVGRAILTAMPDEEREHMLHLMEQDKPDKVAEIREGVAKAVKQVAELGYCTSFGDWRPEVNGIAAPIVSPDGSRIFAINVGGPSFLVSSPEELTEHYGAKLVDACRAPQPQYGRQTGMNDSPDPLAAEESYPLQRTLGFTIAEWAENYARIELADCRSPDESLRHSPWRRLCDDPRHRSRFQRQLYRFRRRQSGWP